MKNKKRLFIASALSLTFATAAHLEWTGYSLFDRQQGSNWLCKADPGCRHLTNGEIALAKGYFGQTLNYNKIKIFNRPFMGILGGNYAAIAPNGNIYIVDEHRRFTDHTYEPPERQKLMIHELTHVAQWQGGFNVQKMALRELIRHHFNYAAAYEYSIQTPLAFDQYNLEQQARMMEDYFSKRQQFIESTTFKTEGGQTYRVRTLGDKWIKGECTELSDYETKLSLYFPILPEELCRPDTQGTGINPYTLVPQGLHFDSRQLWPHSFEQLMRPDTP